MTSKTIPLGNRYTTGFPLLIDVGGTAGYSNWVLDRLVHNVDKIIIRDDFMRKVLADMTANEYLN